MVLAAVVVQQTRQMLLEQAVRGRADKGLLAVTAYQLPLPTPAAAVVVLLLLAQTLQERLVEMAVQEHLVQLAVLLLHTDQVAVVAGQQQEVLLLEVAVLAAQAVEMEQRVL